MKSLFQMFREWKKQKENENEQRTTQKTDFENE
jgi:hypothetical protein